MALFGLQARMEQQEIGTFGDLARRLYARRPKPTGLPPGKRSLETYLGSLARGDDGWFRTHREVLNALADELDASPDEFLKQPERQPVLRPFRDFPQLPPLDLNHEAPCLLLPKWEDIEYLFGSVPAGVAALPILETATRVARFAASGTPRPRWIAAPSGSGARLMARWFEAQQRGRCLEALRLADVVGAPALQETADKVFVLLAEADVESDAAAAQTLSAVTRLVVIAPFRFPLLDSPEALAARGAESAGHSARSGNWSVESLKLATDWRRRLLSWIAARLGAIDTAFDAGKLLIWLQEFDPDESLFPVPGDLMPICALLHEHGPHWLRRQKPEQLSARLIEAQIAKLPETADGRLWLSAQAANVLRELLYRRLKDLSLPLRGGSPAEVWARHFPKELLPARLSEQEARAAVSRLTKQKGPARRETAARLVARIAQPDPREAVALLQQAGLLRTDQDGGLSAHPRWTQEMSLAEVVNRSLEREAPEKWGLWSVEPQRREVLDMALDRLEPKALEACIDRAVREFQPSRLGSVGAVEALFAAVGRRLQDRKSWRPTAGPALTRLHGLLRCADSVRAKRGGSPDVLPMPCTRIDGYGEHTGAFIAACWAWSFWLPAPSERRSDDPSWLWPGWGAVATADLAEVPGGGQAPSDTFLESGSFARAGDRLFELLDLFLDRCAEAAPPRHLSSMWAPFMVLHAARRGWSMEALGHYNLSQQCDDLLLRRAAELSSDARSRLATWLMLSKHQKQGMSIGQELTALHQRRPALHRFIVENADAEAIKARLMDDSPQRLLYGVGGLPKELRQWVLQRVTEDLDHSIDSLIGTLEQGRTDLTPAEMAELLAEVAIRRSDYSWNLQQKLYALSVPHALTAAAQIFRREPAEDRNKYWFTEAPRAMNVRLQLVSLIRELLPAERPPWIRGWLAAMLHYAGEHTEAIFRMIQGQE